MGDSSARFNTLKSSKKKKFKSGLVWFGFIDILRESRALIRSPKCGRNSVTPVLNWSARGSEGAGLQVNARVATIFRAKVWVPRWAGGVGLAIVIEVNLNVIDDFVGCRPGHDFQRIMAGWPRDGLYSWHTPHNFCHFRQITARYWKI